MKYKIGDKVTLTNGDIMTVYQINDTLKWYFMKEDPLNCYTDEMIEGLVEEEAKFGTASNPLEIKSNANCLTQEKVDKPEPKFKVGDKITNDKYQLTIQQIVSDKYIVEDNFGECGIVYFNDQDYWKSVEEETPLYKAIVGKNGNMTGEFVRLKEVKQEINLPKGYIFKDENGNIINATKIVLEKKKKEYPKTYQECCKVLNYKPDFYDADKFLIYGYMCDKLRSFQKLLVCRDAYWKLYGEEMGLEKPWEPDWSTENEIKYVIEIYHNNVRKNSQGYSNTTFAFPTKEICDTFKENFDPDIENCKEFL